MFNTGDYLPRATSDGLKQSDFIDKVSRLEYTSLVLYNSSFTQNHKLELIQHCRIHIFKMAG